MSSSMQRLILVILLAVLIGYAVIGIYARPSADDFCQAASAYELGVLGAIENYYMGWSGRYSHLFVASIVAFGGVTSSQIGPGLLVAGLVASVWYAIRPLSRHSLLLSASLVAAFLAVLPNPWQSLYWLPGSITYVLPLVGVMLSVAILTNRHPVWLLLPLTFVTGGFNEGLTLVQAVVFVTGMMVWRGRRQAMTLGSVGALVALVLVIAAPGNQVRSEAIGVVEDSTMMDAIQTSAIQSFVAMLYFLVVLPGIALFVCVISRYTLMPQHLRIKHRVEAVLALFLAIFGFGLIAIFPASWAGVGASARTLTLNSAILIVGAASFGWLAQLRIKPIFIGLLLLLGPVMSFWSVLGQQPQLVRAAAAFDQSGDYVALDSLMELDSAWSQPCYQAWIDYWQD